MTRETAAIRPGRLVLVVGPSGAGKDTLIGIVRELCAAEDRFVFPVRTVTRPPSASEENLSITPAEFDAAAARGAFALHWQAHGLHYGIARTIEDDLDSGRTVIVNVSRTIVTQARAAYDDVVVVLVTASADVLAQRLAARGRASDTDVGERLQRAALDADVKADVVIDNVGDVDLNAQLLLKAIG